MAYPERKTRVFETQELTGYLDHLLIKTPESIEITADKETEPDNYYEQAEVLVNIINIVRMRANVVIIGITSESISLAVEAENAAIPAEIQQSIRDMGASVPFGDSTVDLTGVQVVRSEYNLVDNTSQFTSTIAFGASAETVVGSASQGDRIVDVTVEVTTAFDTAATLSVGDAGDNARFVASGDIDLTQTGTYSVSPDFEYQSATDIVAYYTANSATAGELTVTVTYV